MYNIKLKSFKTLLVCMAAGLVVFAGCVKDEDFDNHVYGITDPAKQPKGVLFQSSKRTADGIMVPVTTGLVGLSTSQDITTVVKIAADKAVSTDLHIQIVVNNDLLTGTNLTPLDPALYTIPTSEVVIPAGEKFSQFTLTIPNASIIDPSSVYGVGFTISTVGEGYTIAENSKDLVLGVAIRNKYDGIYTFTGATKHPVNSTLTGSIAAFEVTLPTYDINSVKWDEDLNGTHPWSDASGSALPADYSPIYRIDPVTNDVSVTNPLGLAENEPTADNHYDPDTKTIYAAWRYLGGGGYRQFYDTLVYLKPRP
jgi:hypothetical protein